MGAMGIRIGVVSDTHVPGVYRSLPDTLWRALEGCDQVIHAGDFDGWETYQQIKSRFPTIAVVGNKDDFRACEEVPESRILTVGGHTIGITHGCGPCAGLPQRVAQRWTGGPVDLLIFGHSHDLGLHEIGGQKLLNPGSATDVLADRCSIALLDVGEIIQISFSDIET
jgi:hypothetical protein